MLNVLINKYVKKNRPEHSQLCSISIRDNVLSILHTPDAFTLTPTLFGETLTFQDPGKIESILNHYFTTHKLNNALCGVIIHPPRYELLEIDKPEVEESEYNQAIRWQIGDRIDEPMDEISLEAFPAPEAPVGHSKLYVIKSQIAYLRKLATIINQAKLICKFIDIRELILANIIPFTEDTDQSALILELDNQSNHMMIYNQGSLYLSRYFKGNILEHGIESLGQEIKKSIDYYTQRFLKPSPAKLYISNHQALPFSAEEFGLTLGMEIAQLENNHILPGWIINPIFCQDSYYWPSLGGLIRLLEESQQKTL